ncbi:MAG TPA: DUF3224 domain-containing protein [Polyangiaceae bacterium]|nr:DUF3224 domain-containing protein [Polyangiaceae bacterium]
MHVRGTFEIKMQAEPPYDDVGGVPLSRASFEKQFSGALQATSQVQMLAARTPIPNSAGYVALERIVGSLEGKQGSFVVVHVGIMTRGERSLQIRIVPDSGTDQLQGIAGRMDIQIIEGQHFYELEYSLGAPAQNQGNAQ